MAFSLTKLLGAICFSAIFIASGYVRAAVARPRRAARPRTTAP
jgi:hypothetical protein